jgi:sulfur relay protein TusB/DsrH
LTNTTLFTVSKSWHESTWLFEQQAFASSGDAIMLMQDAVLALQSPLTLASFLGKCQVAGVQVYALQDDCDLRGIDGGTDKYYAEIKMVDYAGLVALVVEHAKQVSW